MGAGRSPLGKGDPHQGRDGAADLTPARFIMATIGSFTKNETGFIGSVHTLSVKAKARITPVADKDKASAPDYRIFAGSDVEIGAAWRKTAKETGRDYLSVKLDDPSFAAPIYASLIETDDGKAFSLIWSRRSAD